MIGKNQQDGAGVHILHRLAGQAVHAPVEVFNDAAAFLHLTVEHVLHAVAGVEHARHHSAAGVRQRVFEHGFAFSQNEPGLLEKRRFADGSLVPCPGWRKSPAAWPGKPRNRKGG